MKIWILSDFHLKSLSKPLLIDPPAHDIFICAGDIGGDIGEGVSFLSCLTSKPSFFVAGNHEFYGFEGKSLSEAYELGYRTSINTEVIILENEEKIINGIRILGSTLWTNYCIHGIKIRNQAMKAAINSFNGDNPIKITSSDGASRIFRPSDAARLHKTAKNWLLKKLSEPYNGKTIVITHHAPYKLSIEPQFSNNILLASFVSHLPDLVEHKNAPELWIHGHTHRFFDYSIGQCRVVCNPLGYLNENTGSILDFVVEI